MSATTTLSLDGAELTVETSALFRAWFERHLGKPSAPSFSAPTARPGERYLGSIIEPNGRVRHTFLMPGDEKKNWNDGWKWAQSKGGDLPDRIEQAMLFAYMPEEFQKEAYWSNTQHAAYSLHAWSQGFNNGSQDYDNKINELRVRAVRREFSDSVI
ncbi:MAG TPA: hypothetical protein PLU16_15020 [Gallionellaceae bacterium]|jgi:hypothetical protein|nr:hypothetical protein [Gallionellaceae bacterium]HQS76517.1 hypothetical protein [Gallionellaceae bacterium]